MTFKASLLALAIAAGAALNPSTGEAIEFRNCTGEDIRIHVYNDNDDLKWIARAGDWLEEGKHTTYNAGNGKLYVRIFRAQFLDSVRLGQGGVAATGAFKVVSGVGNAYVLEGDTPEC